jgi:hypothetical protein
MKKLSRMMMPALAAAAVMAGGCTALTGAGPHKVVLNEGVCANVRFLQLQLNKTNHVVLDNKKHSEGQAGMSITFEKFPVIVKGEVPQGSVIGDQLSTIRLHANPGEQSTVDLVPTFTGTFKATCGTSVTQGAGVQIQQKDISFQIK